MLELVPAGSPNEAALLRAIGELRSVVATIGNSFELEPDLLQRLTTMVDEAQAVIANTRVPPPSVDAEGPPELGPAGAG